MDQETLEALQGSIAKWEGIVAGTGKDEGAENCPLCKKHSKYNDESGEYECFECPVKLKSLKHSCEGTPYIGTWPFNYPDDIEKKGAREAAQKEVDFLKSLLPKESNGKD